MHAALTRPTRPDDHLARPGYRPDIDGLRALAVLAVVGFHAFPDWIRGGFIGVDIFFVISGFLISTIVFRSLADGRFSFSAFYGARVRRIFSALAVVLAACLACGGIVLVSSDFDDLGKHVAGGAAFVSNLVLWSETGYFAAAAETQPLLHLWSLGIEEQFYVVWPLLLVLAWKRHFNWLAAIAVIIAASFVTDLYLTRHDSIASFYSPASRFWELMIGGALAYLAFHGREPFSGHREMKAVIGVALIAVALALITRNSAFPGWWALLPTLGAFLVISAGPEAWINHHLFANGAAVWIGLVSYPLYLWHWPLLAFARIVGFGETGRWTRIGAVGASFVLAWLTYVLVERPVRSRGHDRVKVLALCAVMAALFATGLFIHSQGGWPGRPADDDPRAQFVHRYDELRKGGLRRYYRSECNFYDWRTARRKAGIDPDCTRPGVKGTYFLWGDSQAQALSFGLHGVLPEGVRLAQVATSGCKPALRDVERATPGDACNDSNRFAREAIGRIKPDVVIVAQLDGHLATNWEEIADFIHRAGGKRVVLVGPAPEWHPTLAGVIARDYWGKPHARVASGIDAEILALDRKLAARYAESRKVVYASLERRLCNPAGCLATVPGRGELSLTAADYTHFTPEASVYVAREILSPFLAGGALR